jgi:hypothetical protein
LIEDDECRRATAIVEQLGHRWNSGMLLALARGASRFTEIVTRIDGLSDRMLAARLKPIGRCTSRRTEIEFRQPCPWDFVGTTPGPGLVGVPCRAR